MPTSPSAAEPTCDDDLNLGLASPDRHGGICCLADLRAAAHASGIAARIALLTFAAELALNTLSTKPGHEEGAHALDLAARLASGEPVDPYAIARALLHDDQGLMICHERAPDCPQAQAWTAIEDALGYAAWHGCVHRGMHPNPLVESFESPDALDITVDAFMDVPGLDWAALERAAAFVCANGSEAAEGWGKPLRVADLRRAAAHVAPTTRRA